MTDTKRSRISRDQARLIAFVVIVLLLGAAWLVIAQVLQNESSTSESFADVRSIRVDAGTGDVELVPAPGQDVSVQRLDNYVFNKPSVSQKLEGDTLVLKSECGGVRLGTCASDYEIGIPANVAVESVTGSGDFEANNIRSDVSVKTNSGDIDAEQMYGALDFETKSGDVDLQQVASLQVRAVTESGDVGLVTVSGPDKVEVTTDSGDVDVKFPEDFGPYKVDASSSTGVATVDLSSDPSAQREVTVRSASGDVVVTRTQ